MQASVTEIYDICMKKYKEHNQYISVPIE